ncbi:MAG TPA: TIGR03545 family protein [Lacipirellulaceae bacterium]|nr:TIGR03545 family protein [Lacipirellulaceae bacterium]
MKRSILSALRTLKSGLRWGYVLPRAAVLAAIYCAVRFGLDPALHYAVIASGEAVLGARVEVAALGTSLGDGTVTLDGLAAANPGKPMRNLVSADRMKLEFDMAALAKRRFVVKAGVVRGLQFDTQRATSGALEGAEPTDAGPSILDPVAAAASDAAVAWFAGLQGRLEEDLESKLATPRAIHELDERWRAQYSALKRRSEALRAQAKQLEQQFGEVKKNPLRGIERLESLKQQLGATQAELKATLAEIQTLPAQAKADRAAIDAARKQDAAFLKETLATAKSDGGQLTEYLLGDLADGYIAQSVGWAQYLRTWVPKSKIERPARARGTNVLFVDRRLPRVLVERVALTGSARVGGQPLEFTGLLTDATTEPTFHQRPTQLHLVAAGAVAGELLATLDGRGAVPRTTIVLDCPHLMLGERSLGKPESLAVNVAAGEASITAEIVVDGDDLSGFVRVHQQSTLVASTPALRDDRIAAMLSESLRGVDRLEANISLAGTVRKPRCTIESNVGPQLAAGINGAARKYLTERRDRLAAKVRAAADEHLAQLEATRQAAQQELLAMLGEDQQVVAQLASLVGGNGGLGALNVPQMGSALKLDKLKR